MMGAPGDGWRRSWRRWLVYRAGVTALYWLAFVVLVLALFGLGACAPSCEDRGGHLVDDGSRLVPMMIGGRLYMLPRAKKRCEGARPAAPEV